MVEQATHNRQVTGSNPVGATGFSMLDSRSWFASTLVLGLLFGSSLTVRAQEQPLKSVALQGTVTRQALPVSSLTATIEQQVKRPFPGPPGKFVAVTLHIKNPNVVSMILDGNNAVASYANGSKAQNASEKEAVGDASNTLTTKQKIAVAVVTLGTATLAGPLFYEWIQGGSSNPKVTMGVDEVRRRVEGLRLGSRVLLPGEESDGTVFLPADQGMPTSIVIPVLTFPNRESAGALRVDIAAAPASQN
jgi:hypothetical protein